MRKKAFTLVELLVVIAIIALLMGILMPALARVKVIANRMVCGSHLADIGKAMMMYAGENSGNYPVGGLFNGSWNASGSLTQWDAKDRKDAFGNVGATITSCFYLLVRYEGLSPKQFLCSGDVDTKEFKISDYTTTIKEFTQAWDFGDNPGMHCSYTYNYPFSVYAMGTSSSSANPLCADRNPYLDKNAIDYINGANPKEAAPVFKDNDYSDPDLTGNSASHQRKAQNVLFNDGHVRDHSYPNVGYSGDNIWKYWTTSAASDEERLVTGLTPKQGICVPKSKDDTCLVSERNDNKK